MVNLVSDLSEVAITNSIMYGLLVYTYHA